MRAAIYQINSKYIHSSLASWYLCAAVGEVCDAVVLEGSINERDEVLFERIKALNCDAVCFSVYIWNIDTVVRLSKSVKQYAPSVKIILGGPEVAYRARAVLESYPYVDYVISGEGEVPLSRLLSALSDGKSERVEGVSGRDSGGIYISEPYVMECDPPCPYTDAYFDALGSRISYIETSRGCPFSCAFCLSGRQKLRFFDIERSKRDILKLAGSGTSTVKFVDRTFNADRRRAVEILGFIIEKHACGEIPDGVTFHFEISGALADDAFLSTVKKAPAGLFQFEIGVQSFNENTLRAINRTPDTEKLCRVIRELSSFGNVHIHTDLIAGLPHEDKESFKASYNKLYALGSHKIQLGFLKLLWGSDMVERRELYPCEYESSAPYKVKSTPWLCEDDMRELETAERANDGIFFSGRFDRTVKYLLSATGKTPYDLAYFLGRELYGENSLPLDTLFCRLYEAVSKEDGVDAARLRDIMLCDRIEKNNSCVIPKALKISDVRLKRFSQKIDMLYPRKRNVRRSVGILYTEGKVIFADYDSPHPVTDKYTLHSVDICDLEKENEA